MRNNGDVGNEYDGWNKEFMRKKADAGSDGNVSRKGDAK